MAQSRDGAAGLHVATLCAHNAGTSFLCARGLGIHYLFVVVVALVVCTNFHRNCKVLANIAHRHCCYTVLLCIQRQEASKVIHLQHIRVGGCKTRKTVVSGILRPKPQKIVGYILETTGDTNLCHFRIIRLTGIGKEAPCHEYRVFRHIYMMQNHSILNHLELIIADVIAAKIHHRVRSSLQLCRIYIDGNGIVASSRVKSTPTASNIALLGRFRSGIQLQIPILLDRRIRYVSNGLQMHFIAYHPVLFQAGGMWYICRITRSSSVHRFHGLFLQLLHRLDLQSLRLVGLVLFQQREVKLILHRLAGQRCGNRSQNHAQNEEHTGNTFFHNMCLLLFLGIADIWTARHTCIPTQGAAVPFMNAPFSFSTRFDYKAIRLKSQYPLKSIHGNQFSRTSHR